MSLVAYVNYLIGLDFFLTLYGLFTEHGLL